MELKVASFTSFLTTSFGTLNPFNGIESSCASQYWHVKAGGYFQNPFNGIERTKLEPLRQLSTFIESIQWN